MPGNRKDQRGGRRGNQEDESGIELQGNLLLIYKKNSENTL